MSGAPIMIGTNQLPKPPISTGITTKKIMVSPWVLTQAFQAWPSAKNCSPGWASSRRMSIDIATATNPARSEKTT
jgi:hypothetical protein